MIRVWEFLKTHKIFAWCLVIAAFFVMVNPLAGAGWLLLATMAAMLWQLGRRLVIEWRKARTLTEVHLPGGVLTVRGPLAPHQLDDIRTQWNRSNVEPITLPPGVKWVRVGPPRAHGSLADALEADGNLVRRDGVWTETDGIHPPLPSEFREAWNTALSAEVDRVNAEGDAFQALKVRYRELVTSDAGPDSREVMIRRSRGISGPREKVLRELADELEAISPEGARLGELLYRGSWVPTGRRPAPEIPRTWVPILDRSFSTTTDCRYHHMAEHGIEALRDGVVVRRCDVCEPSTFWIENV